MKITVYKNRCVDIYNIAGTQFEQNATTIQFDFSELDFLDDDCIKSIHLFHDHLGENSYIGDAIIENNEIKITKSMTKCEKAFAFIQITKEDFIWKTQLFKLAFYKSLDVDKAIEEDQLGLLQKLILEMENLDNIVSKNVANGESILIDDALKYKIFGAKVDGNASQNTTTGKNYFNACAINNAAIAVENDGQTIAIDAVTAGNGAISTHKTLAELCPNLAVGDQFVLRFNRNLGNTYNNFIYLDVPVAETWKNGTSKTITEEMLGCEVQLYGNRYIDGETEQCIITDFTIMKTNETNTDFEKFTNNEPSPNQDYPQDITVIKNSVKIKQTGKNLIAKQGLSTPLNENDYYDSRTSFLTPGVDGWGHLECNNSSGSSSKYINIFVKKKNIYVKENSKYTLFVELKNVSNLSYLTVNQVVNNDLFQELRGINNGELVSDGIYKFYVTTKEVLSDDMVLRIYTGVPAGNVISFDMRLMILESDWTEKEVEYEQYKSNEYTIDLQGNELVKLADDIKDEITIDKNGNVSLLKNTTKKIFDGTESWNEFDNQYLMNCVRFRLNYDINDINALCDKLQLKLANEYWINDVECLGYSDTSHYIVGQIKKSRLDENASLQSFKDFLAENNLTVYHKLTEPTTSSITQLTNFKTFEEVNHFFLETNIATNFEIKYAQDLQKVISKQQEEINELKTLLSSTATSALLLDNYESDLINEIESEVEQ